MYLKSLTNIKNIIITFSTFSFLAAKNILMISSSFSNMYLATFYEEFLTFITQLHLSLCC